MGSERLDAICELIVDCPHKTAPRSDEAFGYAVGTTAIDEAGRIDLQKARPVSEQTYRVWTARAVPEAGDLILCREAPVGPVALIPAGVPICLGQRTMLLRIDQRRVDPRWLAFKLRDRTTLRALLSRSEGSTVVHLNVSDVRRFELEVPDLACQRAIADVLGALDDKIESNRRLAQALDAAAAALFAHELLIEPSADPRSVALPAGYVAGRLRDLVSVEMGQSPPGSTYNSEGNGLPLVQGVGGYGERHPIPSLWTTDPRKRVPMGTTLMTVRAPVGAVNVTRLETALGRGVAGITCESRYFAEYLVRSLAGRWHAEEAGTIFPSVNGKQIRDLPMVIPPRQLVDEIDKTLKPFVDRIEAVMEETQTVIAIRDALLPKLVSGRIRVSLSDDMEEPIAAAMEALT